MIYPAPAFAKGGDSEEHLGGVFVPSPLSSYRSGENYGIIKCHKLIVIIFTISFSLPYHGKKFSHQFNRVGGISISLYLQLRMRIAADHFRNLAPLLE